MFDHTITILGTLALVTVFCHWLAWRLRLPLVLLLLGAGIALGPLSGLVQPAALFGEALAPLLSLAVAVIAFEAGLGFRRDRRSGSGVTLLSLLAADLLLQGAAIAAAVHFLLGLPWPQAALFGLLALITGSGEMLPLLRRVRPGVRLTALLRQEAALLAPLGALLAVLFHAGLLAHGQQEPLLAFGRALLAGVALGLVGAQLLALLLRHHQLPGHLVNLTALALALGGYALAEGLGQGGGLLAALIMGMALAHMKDLAVHEAVDLRESLSAAALSLLVLLVAAQLHAGQLALPGAETGLLLGIILLLRPITTLLATIGSGLNWRERLLAGWIAPRGLLALALASLFALHGGAAAQALLPLTLLLVVVTLVWQHLTAYPLGRLLGASEAEPRGVLIVGAHSLARAIARALEAEGVRAVLADSDWEDIQQARMDGLTTYPGNPVSEQTERSLDLIGIGHLLALSHRPALNAQACQRYAAEFGADRVYSLLTAEEKRATGKSAIGRHYAATRLFGGELTLTQLNGMVTRGGAIGIFSRDEAKAREDLIPLFVLGGSGTLQVVTGGRPVVLPGDRLLALVPTPADRLPVRADSAIVEPTPA